MSTLLVRRPGWQTTVQDLGRWGHQADGVPVAGPMDPFAHRLANALVGNDQSAAALEAAFVGPEIEFEDARVVAVTGARFTVTLDGRPAPLDEPFDVARGGRVRFGDRIWGCRSYVAITGGVLTPLVLGSRATDLASRTGGVEGRALRAGDRLPLGPAGHQQPVSWAGASVRAIVPPVERIDAEGSVVRVLPGPHLDWFAVDALERLQSAPYRIGPESNRMGYRLDGPAFDRIRTEHFPSDATPLGSLQVTAPGRLVLLMADHQTTGGYPKVGIVITADIGLVAQSGPGDVLRFEACDLSVALTALGARDRALREIEVRSR